MPDEILDSAATEQPAPRPVAPTPIADAPIATAKSATAKKRKSTTKKSSSKKRSSSKKSTWEPIRGVNISWRKLLGIDRWSRKTGIPTTQAGVERKLGKWLLDWLRGLFTSKK